MVFAPMTSGPPESNSPPIPLTDMKTKYSPGSLTSRRGVALITVLSLIALLTVTLIAFFALVGEDRQRSREFLDLSQSNVLVETAFQEALAKIIEGSEEPWRTSRSAGGSVSGQIQGASMTASPGLMEIRYFFEQPNRGDQAGATAFTDPESFFRNPFAREYNGRPANPRWIPLFSWQRFAPAMPFLDSAHTIPNPDFNPAAVFNLNTAFNPFYPGEPYLSGYPGEAAAVKFMRVNGASDEGWPVTQDLNNPDPDFQLRVQDGESSYDRPFYVQWIPVLENPFVQPGGDNRMIGRYAYWVDVENTKINLNTNTRNLLSPSTGRNLSILASILGHPEGNSFIGSADAVTLRGGTPEFGNRLLHFQSVRSSDPVPSFMRARRDLIDGQQPVLNAAGSNNSNQKIRGPNGIRLIDGTFDDFGGNNQASARTFDLMLGWEDRFASGTATWSSNREDALPTAADNSVVDWQVFTGVRPWFGGQFQRRLAMENLFDGYGRIVNGQQSLAQSGRFNTIHEMYSLLDPAARTVPFNIAELDPSEVPPSLADIRLRVLRRTHGLSATIYGYDEERDPLGKPKIDLVAFLRQAASATSPGNIISTSTGTELWARLNNPQYHFAYAPGGNNVPYATDISGGRSFVQAFNAFAGDGNQTNNRNGEDFVLQMLTNIVEYTRPHDAPPIIDRSRGIIGAKSMPYVFEVLTRGRNSLWSLAEANRELNYFSPRDSTVQVSSEDLLAGWSLRTVSTLDTDTGLYTHQYFLDYSTDGASPDLNSFLKPRLGASSDFSAGTAPNGADNWLIGTVIDSNSSAPSQDLDIEYVIDSQRVEQFLNNSNESGHPLSFSDLESYLRNIIVDMSFGFANPNPFHQGEFEGYFRPSFANLPSGMEIPNGGSGFPFAGNYVTQGLGGIFSAPSYNQRVDQIGLRHQGFTVYVPFANNLSTGDGWENPNFIPIPFDTENARFGQNTFRLNGWQITNGAGQVFHEVPLGLESGSPRNLGRDSNAVLWWEMTRSGLNAGPSSPMSSGSILPPQWSNGFRAFQERRSVSTPNPSPLNQINPAIPLGWFSFTTSYQRWPWTGVNETSTFALSHTETASDDPGVRVLENFHNMAFPSGTLTGLGNRTLRIDGTYDEPQGELTVLGRAIQDFLGSVRSGVPMTEVIWSVDPVTGHRTTNPDLTVNNPRVGGSRQGHFQGDLGHTWRRVPSSWGRPDGMNRIEEVPLLPTVSEEVPDIEYDYQTVETTVNRTLPDRIVNEGNVWRVIPGETIQETVTTTQRIEPGRPITRVITTGGISIGSGITEGQNPGRQGLASNASLVGFGRDTSLGRTVGNRQRWVRNRILHDIDGIYEIGVNGFASREVEGPSTYAIWMGGHGDSIDGLVRNRSFFSHAPRGELMTSPGEIGFVHSGLPGRPIDLAGPSPVWNFGYIHSPTNNLTNGNAWNDFGMGPNAINAPQNGPATWMLLDLFTPGAFRDNHTGVARTRTDWENSGENNTNRRSNSPLHPRRGTWNVNVAIAGDNYLAIKAGSSPNITDTSFNVDNLTSYPVWIPSAQGFQSERWRNMSQFFDPFLNYYPRYRRGFENWISLIGGDFTPSRSIGSGMFRTQDPEVFRWRRHPRRNFSYGALGLPTYTWISGVSGPNLEDQFVVQFDPDRRSPSSAVMHLGSIPNPTGYGTQPPARGMMGHLFADGVFSYDGRQVFENRLTGGGLSAVGTPTTNFAQALNNPTVTNRVPLERITRFALYPMRHFNSDIWRHPQDAYDIQIRSIGGNNFGAVGNAFGFSNLVTGLNPEHMIGQQAANRGSFGWAGPWYQSGIFRNAPIALAANQISTSANVFTMHIVAQTIRDNANFGDFSFEDEVLAEQWAQIVVARLPDERTLTNYRGGNFDNPSYDYRVLFYKVVDNPR